MKCIRAKIPISDKAKDCTDIFPPCGQARPHEAGVRHKRIFANHTKSISAENGQSDTANLPGERKNATFENKSEGVKRETLSRFTCYEQNDSDVEEAEHRSNGMHTFWVARSSTPRLART